MWTKKHLRRVFFFSPSIFKEKTRKYACWVICDSCTKHLSMYGRLRSQNSWKKRHLQPSGVSFQFLFNIFTYFYAPTISPQGVKFCFLVFFFRFYHLLMRFLMHIVFPSQLTVFVVDKIFMNSIYYFTDGKIVAEQSCKKVWMNFKAW